MTYISESGGTIKRRTIYAELELRCPAVLESLRELKLLDHLVEFRLVMPPQIAENPNLIERAWTQKTKGIQ